MSLSKATKRAPEPELFRLHRNGKRGSPLSVGTDFSGLEAPIIALKTLRLDHEHLFSSDNNKACQKIINHCYGPTHLHEDVSGRDTSGMPRVDLYIFGFPCQPFSRMGKRAGAFDKRGLLVDESLKYIKDKHPRCILGENVETFPTQHPELMAYIITTLEALNYTCEWKILNSLDYCIPQSRPRWYLSGIDSDFVRANTDLFPPPFSVCVPLDSLVTKLPTDQWQAHPPKDTLAYKNVMKAYAKATAKGVNPFISPVVVDAGASEKFSNSRIGGCPCLTRSRAGTFGHWCSTKGGYLDTADMSRLMGFEESMVDWAGAGVSAFQYASCLGNSMSVNILTELIPRILYKAKLCTNKELDSITTLKSGM